MKKEAMHLKETRKVSFEGGKEMNNYVIIKIQSQNKIKKTSSICSTFIFIISFYHLED